MVYYVIVIFFNIIGMVMALIDSAYDKDESVRESVMNAMHNVGSKQTALVLSSCHQYIRKHAKVNLY